MRQQMAAATLSRKSKLIESSTLRSDLCFRRQVHQLSIRWTSILTTKVLDETIELLPLACEGKITRVATDYDWEVHAVSFIWLGQFVFRRLEQ